MLQSDPFREFDVLFNRGARGVASFPGAMDAYRRGNDVWVHMDVPGVAADSLDISVERGVLTVSGERTWQRQEGDQVYFDERQPGAFRRQVRLGDGLDVEHIEADCHDGVLTVRIPVAQQAQPRRIQVNARPEAIETTTVE